MGDRVEIAFRQAADELLPSGISVLVAVSGGGDSVALLHLMCKLRDRALIVAHLDHGLRRGSGADRRFVERLARTLSLPCLADRRDVTALRRRDESSEEAARRVRRGFLVEAASQAGAGKIATGHTLDDQAETILMRLVRGAGATALTGMSRSGPGRFVRPLLGLQRNDLRGWLARKGHTFREDPTNRSLGHDRNRVRRLVLPVLTETLNPRAGRHLVKAARRFREDAVYLDRLAGELADQLSRRLPGGRLSVDGRKLVGQAPPLRKRVARLLLGRAGIDPRRVATRHIDALIDLVQGPGRRIDLPGGLSAVRRPAGRLHLGPGVSGGAGSSHPRRS